MTTPIQQANILAGQAVISGRGQTILINELGRSLLLDQEPTIEAVFGKAVPDDASWVRQSFITTQDPVFGTQKAKLSNQDRFNRSFSAAALEYVDTSPGGNRFINPPAGFTPYADIRPKRLAGDNSPVGTSISSPNTTWGQGRYYQEAIQQNAQVIHLRFGVAQFNSLAQFFTGFYNGDLAANARAARYTEGVLSKVWITIGQAIGLAVAPLFLIPLAVMFIGNAARFMLNMPTSQFYTVKPAMPLYWMAVNNIVNQLAVNSGLSSFVNTEQSRLILKGGAGTQELKKTEVMNLVGNFLPAGLIKSAGPAAGTIDVFAIANRANRKDIAYQERLAQAYEKAGPNASWAEVARRFATTSPIGNFIPGDPSFEVYFKKFLDFFPFTRTSGTGESFEKDPRQGGLSADGKSYSGDEAAAKAPGFFDYFVSQLNDGGEWVSYRVDYTGAQQDSFSNSVVESSLSSRFNDMSRRAKELRFNLADGNVTELVGGALDAVRGLVSGISSVIHIDGLAALAGSAYVNMPKMWNESTANLAKSNYSLTLISPYGNPVSILLNIWLPLATLLAGVLPLATGKQSHTSPFLCQLHDRGRMMSRTAIIDSMTINRGTSNLGFTREGMPLAIEVSFSVALLDGIVALPITQGFDPLNPLEGLFDGENAFSDYLMTLSAMKLSDTIYRAPMLKYQINKKLADIGTFFSASHFASYVASLPGVELLGAAMRGTAR